MDLPCARGLGPLLLLPGVLGSGGRAKGSAGSSLLTVVLLLLLLLLLVAGLVLAWRRLSRDSGGYYHPARLGAALWGRTCRLFWASPPGQWLQAQVGLESPDQDRESQDEQDLEEDYDLDGGQEEADGGKEELPGAERPGPPVEVAQPAEEEPEAAAEERLTLVAQGPVSSGGSAEALLSDLHAFAGSAAWDDSAGAAGGPGLHVTAL
ncbi:PREDICTED: protein tyrosine phosphatase receptor type C-associated protein [Condylura cristata]|uniref:protein tyrosine phosphatase receptor type C-associated protein n=1 Tax=Condylura cristata TaxID=143302 RepID=UPI000642AE2E|nr:PREDICTED: protein tyrosine phosphatase receptor type C-associated protein [Condylura cristata]